MSELNWWDRCLYGVERAHAYKHLVGILCQAGVADELAQVLVAAWNETRCYPPVDPASELADDVHGEESH